MQKQREKAKREEHYTCVGPYMKKAIDRQKEKVKDLTYGMDISDYEACEIIAKKFLEIV